MAHALKLDSEDVSMVSGYNFLDKIAYGAFGDVVRVQSTEDKSHYAAKVASLDSSTLVPTYNEVNVLKSLNHENIIQLKDVITHQDGHSILLVMELADFGNLEDYLRAYGEFSDDALMNNVGQLCRAMEYLHSRLYAHRDVTPRNILLFSTGKLKVGDFDQAILCKHRYHMITSSTVIGDPRYFAPEVLNHSENCPILADLWSVGCCVYFMFTSQHLFSGTERDIKRCQVKGKIFYRGENFHHEKYAKLRHVIWKLTQYNPSSRPDLSNYV